MNKRRPDEELTRLRKAANRDLAKVEMSARAGSFTLLMMPEVRTTGFSWTCNESPNSVCLVPKCRQKGNETKYLGPYIRVFRS
jgi:predicted secreted protein